MLAHSHQITNVIIDLDGDRAGSESYVMASLQMKAGEQTKQMSVWGRYIDRWSRRDGRWGIDKRVTVIDFNEIRDVMPMIATSLGARDRGDPSYAVLGLVDEVGFPNWLIADSRLLFGSSRAARIDDG
jgi:hypothetical protein